MSAPLSHRQKAYLAQLARRAWELADREVGTPDEFRHAEVVRACGRQGLRCCGQDEYKRVEAHLLDLCGEHARAFNAGVRAETEGKRVAEAVLLRACRDFGFDLGYPAAICLRQFRCGLADASVQQIWKLIYTVRNRGNARRRAQSKNPQ